jgi:hypothetical protein
MTVSAPSSVPDWERRLAECLPLFGHRNWIAVVDAAYPAQSRPGIETIFASAEQMDVVQKVLDAITASRHIRPCVYADKELAFVGEYDAPGVAEYRRQLDAALYGSTVERIPHEQIIQKLDRAAQLFRVLVIKTETTIPYTSIFFELDCGYWNAMAEQRLRQAMLVSDTK